MTVTSITVLRPCLIPLQKAHQDQQVGLTQTPFNLLPLCQDSECVRFWTCRFRPESPFSVVLWLSLRLDLLVFKVRPSGAHIPSSGRKTSRLRSPGWSLFPFLLGENLYDCDIPSICRSLSQGCGSWPYKGSLLPTHLTVAFSLYLKLWRIIFVTLQLIYIDSCSVFSFSFGVLAGEDERNVFLLHHLEYTPLNSVLKNQSWQWRKNFILQKLLKCQNRNWVQHETFQFLIWLFQDLISSAL